MAELILMKGNEALAEAAIRAGCHNFFGYPITPQTEISEYMAKNLPKVDGTYLQAESEIAAINMVLGASACGARAMTSTSSPGFSLKTEGISYIAGSDLPCLIVNIQRAGPGLGGIQPSQADYFQATKAPGHGDLKLLVYTPSSVQDMVDMVFKAFDNSEKFRVPAMILGDGLLGQMMEPVVFPKINNAVHPKPWATTGTQNKRSPNIINSLYIEPEDLEPLIHQRYKRYAQMEETLSEAKNYRTDDANIILVAYGATSRIAQTAIDLAREQGVKAGLITLLTVWPFPKKQILSATKAAAKVLVVEMSMGQMVEDVQLVVNGRIPVHFYGRTGGAVPTPPEICIEILKIEETT